MAESENRKNAVTGLIYNSYFLVDSLNRTSSVCSKLVTIDLINRKIYVMNFQIKSFSTLRIFSSDLRKSRDWYEKFFGQSPIEDLENFISFQIGNTKFDITAPDQKNPFSTGGSIGYWLVDDINSVLKKAEQIGAKLYRGPLIVPEIQRQILQIQDPFGNVLGFESSL